MTYVPQVWRDYDDKKTETQNIELGAVPTAERLNNIEAGIVEVYEALDLKKADVSKLSKNDRIWIGWATMNGEHEVIPSRALSECENGWKLYFCPFEDNGEPSNRLWSILDVPKHLAVLGGGITHTSVNYRNDKQVKKYLEIANAKIKGHTLNVNGFNISMAMRYVYSY